jgi:CelD/BcsL family acetyltransferase involved in cellulose biosynthesis
MVIRHEDLTSPALGWTPVAEAIGPFTDPRFLDLATPGGLEVFEHDDGAAVLRVAGGVVTFAGDPDLTDYHSPLGSDPAGLFAEVAAAVGREHRFDLDSLPIEAAEPVAKGLEMAGRSATLEQHTVTAVVDLPGTFDEYLQALGKKQRHEVRRKRRRYEEHLGEVVLETHADHGWAFDEFVRLHRMAGGEKGGFMTEERQALFESLLECPGWRIDLLRVPGETRASACLFVYVDGGGYYLYNSSYDVEMREASPGVVIVGAGVAQAIDDGAPRFDFLKGDEPYKFRLGAHKRPLFRVTA